jgi:hypothetical protein
MQSIDRRARVTATLHARDVQSVTLRVIADGQSKRQRVFDNNGVTADVSLFADATKLMYTGIRADVRTILDHYMTRERAALAMMTPLPITQSCARGPGP